MGPAQPLFSNVVRNQRIIGVHFFVPRAAERVIASPEILIGEIRIDLDRYEVVSHE